MSARAVRWALALLLVTATPTLAQSPRLEVERGDGSTRSVAVSLDRGYASVPLSLLADLGWVVAEDQGAVSLAGAGEIVVAMRVGSPFFRWDGVVLQMTDAPYRAGGVTYVPLQFLTDFLPRRLPGLYDFTGARSLLRAGDLTLLRGGAAARAPIAPIRESTSTGRTPARPATTTPVTRQDAPVRENPPARAAERERPPPSPYVGERVVVIDAGHGGADPGALGPDGIREKNVALGIALRLAEALRAHPNIEVHMIRDDDTFVDAWDRGKIATEIKGERPGIFVSIHANSFPARREARGFETYFLSDARTEHERRVSAIENAAISMTVDGRDEAALQDLDFILRDLKNYDHAHWSEDLAGLVQEELDDFHPGPNRGVKQGVLAVLTNALMPSVLVEIGYLSNETEARLMARDDFHQSSADAIAEAVVRFFERYPPGNGTGGAREER